MSEQIESTPQDAPIVATAMTVRDWLDRFRGHAALLNMTRDSLNNMQGTTGLDACLYALDTVADGLLQLNAEAAKMW